MRKKWRGREEEEDEEEEGGYKGEEERRDCCCEREFGKGCRREDVDLINRGCRPHQPTVEERRKERTR